MVAALSFVLRFTVRAGSLLAIGTLVVAGGFGSPFGASSGAPPSASASDTVLVGQPGGPERTPAARIAEVVVIVAAPAPSVASTAPELPAATTAPATPSPTSALPTPSPTSALLIPAPTTDPTAPMVVAETAPSSPARGSTANAAQPAGDPSSAGVLDTCPADWFCYPRLGVAGPILPYSDCSGGADIGRTIVSFTCLSSRSSTYLIGHAYTQFGNVTRWAAGDIVQANGVRYTVTGAITERSCAAPSLPLARLSMQTSLGPSTCGPVLVVQAR